MSTPVSCCNSCDSITTTQVPGPEGDAGENGTDGLNAYTITTANFAVPTVGNTVAVAVENSAWMTIGQVVVAAGPAHFEVISKPSVLGVVLEFLDYPGDVAALTVINSGATISPAGVLAVATPLPTAITDNSTGTAGNTIAAGVGVTTLAIPITLAQITGAGDVLTTYTPGYKFKILAVDARVTEAVTTAGDAADINLEIGTTNLTGGVVALTSANATPLGAVIAGSAVTAANEGTASDTISIEAANVTAFAEGSVILLIRIQNMDTADAVASLADHINDLITALDI